MSEAAAHLSLRDTLLDFVSLGWLRDVARPVDKDWEIACIGRLACESTGEDDAYAIRFLDVRGHDMPVVLGLYASRRQAARTLGVAPAALWERFAEALAAPIAPRLASDAPVKQVILRGDAVDLGRLPVPVWTPGRDRAPYFSSACVVTAERESGIPNLATYRVELQGPRRLGLFFGSERQHGAMHLAGFEKRGEPMPVAFALGAAPAVSYAAAAKVRYGLDEMTIAGGLLRRAVPLVRCETSELLVPADAEIVIEGRVRPGERGDEGPFGEALGYMEGVAPAAVVDVTCLTHRSDAVFHGLVQQLPPSEGHLLMEIGLAGSLWHYLRRQARIEGIRDLGIVPGAAGVSALAVAVRRGDRESVERVVRVLSSMHWGQKLVVVVDDDVDVHDPASVFWALTSRADLARDVRTQEKVPLFQRDPDAFRRAHEAPAAEPDAALLGTKLIVDATVKSDCMAVALPTRDFMRRARAGWGSTGLPALGGTRRLERLLDAHPEPGIEAPLPPAPRAKGAPR
jgi:UbiD family decarboxylase